MPEEDSPAMGLGMKLAWMPASKASRRTTCFAVMMLSDMPSASACRSEIPCCERPEEWKVYSTGTLIFSSMRTVERRRSRAESDGDRSK